MPNKLRKPPKFCQAEICESMWEKNKRGRATHCCYVIDCKIDKDGSHHVDGTGVEGGMHKRTRHYMNYFICKLCARKWNSKECRGEYDFAAANLKKI